MKITNIKIKDLFFSKIALKVFILMAQDTLENGVPLYILCSTSPERDEFRATPSMLRDLFIYIPTEGLTIDENHAND